MKTVFISFLAILLIVGAFFFLKKDTSQKEAERKETEVYAEPIVYRDGSLTLPSGEEIALAVAEKSEDRVRGLSKQKEIKEGEGLLFIFSEDKKHGIWMRDMYFSIDIIWLDKDWKVVDYKENATPESFRSVTDAEVFFPETEARYVLEMAAGSIKKLNLQQNDEVIIKPNDQN